MTTPTGVFVRLPLSEAERELLVDASAFGQPDDSHDKAILSIGTPVTGGELKTMAHISRGGDRISLHRKTERDIPLIRQSDHLAALASLQAKVGRLRGIVNTLSSKISECGSEGYDLSGADCVDLLNDAGLIEWGTFDPEVHESSMFDGCEPGDPIWTLKGPEA